MRTLLSRLIKKASLFLKIDFAYIARGSFWMSLNHVNSALFGFVLAVALAHELPENVYGNYRYILSLGVVAGAFSLTGFNLAFVREVAKGAKGLLKVGFFTQLKWSFGTLLSSLLIGSYYLYKGNLELAFAAFIMALFLPLISSFHLYSSYWEGVKNYRKIGTYNIITTAIYSTTLFVTVQFTDYLPFIILAYFASQAVCTFFFFKKTLREDIGESNVEQVSNTINFGKHISFLNILSTLAAQLDKILIFAHLGAVQLAIYSISQLPTSNIRAIFKQTAQLAYPKYSSKSITEINETIFYKMSVFTVPIVLIVLLYILCAPFLFEIFFPKYTEAVLYSQISILSLLFFQKKLIAYAVLATASKKHIYTMSIWASVYKITLLVILLPPYGIWGAIFAEIIAQATGFFTSILMLKRVSREIK